MNDARREELREKLSRVETEDLSRVEEAQLIGELDVTPDVHEKYEILHILSRQSGDSLRPLFERYLDFTPYPLALGLALKTLFRRWGLQDEYYIRAVDLLDEHEWDVEDDARMAAISALTMASLEGKRRRKVQVRLLELADDPNVLVGVRAWSIFGLGRLLGDAAFARGFRHDFEVDGELALKVREETRRELGPA